MEVKTMSDLKITTQDEVAELINVSRDQVAMPQKVSGKGRNYTRRLDVSNKVKALKVQRRESNVVN